MSEAYVCVLAFNPISLFPEFIAGLDQATMLWIILVQFIILALFVIYETQRFLRRKSSGNIFSRLFRKVQVDVTLDKDRLYRPQVLTLTIRNIGKEIADLDAPILVFRKIWTTRRFKLNGVKGQQLYPMFLNPGMTHHLSIETSTFHQYDRSVKGFYWARILVSDVEGRRWHSNEVKLRKSLFT